MANVVDCTSADFRDLLNPYTGEPMDVKMVIVMDGTVFFHAPDTYSTAQPFGSVKEARRMWSRVDGVFGCRPDDVPATCAYTGETLVPCEDGSYSGGFDPTSFHSREDFLYYATMRDGKSKYPKPSNECAVRVTSVTESAPAPLTHVPDYVEGSIEEAGKIMDKAGFKPQRKTTVACGVKLGKKGK